MKNLENLTIHSFRGLQEISLESLGQINLFVGVNNSGKTSVLEAISTYCRPLDPLEWLNTAWRREIKSSRKPQLEALKWLFPQNSTVPVGEFYQGETHISGDGKFTVRESKAIYREFEGTKPYPDKIEDDIEYEETEYEQNVNTVRGADLELYANFDNRQSNCSGDLEKFKSEIFQIWENERFVNRKKPSDIELPVETVTTFSHRIENLQVRLLSQATLQQFKSEVIQLLQVMDPGIIDLDVLSVRGDTPRLYIHHKQIGISPLSAFGDGVRRLMYIASTLAKVRGGVLLIDELETAIHTEVLKPSFYWLVQWCQQMDVQLFATTHSLETVDELLSASKIAPDLVLYRLYPRESRTKLLRIDRDRLQRVRQDLGMEVRW
ncbi:MAG: AAA family ATPase [Hormoscilla sp. GUM202]|nr:AAA family ATPase [Hormoscilla sp. GUM202]